jgi:hypothetical protein
MRLLNVLTMALLMALVLPLRAQTVDAWISVSPADGSWSAGGDTFYGGDPNCEFLYFRCEC